MRMQITQSLADGLGQAHYEILQKGAAIGVEHLAQRITRHVLHHQVKRVAFGKKVAASDDAGMIQPG